MNELDLQGGYLLNFLCSADGFGYRESTVNTVSEGYVIEEDLEAFLSETSFNQENYRKNFKLAKNGLIIVVDKLQTGFDEPKLARTKLPELAHLLFARVRNTIS